MSQILNKVFIKTFGCRTNIYDSQVMMQNLKDFELVFDEESADIVVINSCTVTNSADSTARGYINALSRKNKKVILAGCGAFSKGEELLKNGKVFGVFGHSEKEKINELLKREERFKELGDLSKIDDTIVENFSSKTKAFIKIQEGCNFRCSYCIIPFVRGDARSQDEDKIIYQVEKLAYNGFGEYVLTGTNIGSYGRDKGSSIAKLLKRMSMIKGVKRIRLGSLEPVQIDDEFKELLMESWLEKHLHIALQHTNDEMLKIMRRRNFVKEDLKLFEELRDKGFALGTDFIVGHPGESEALWNNAKETFKKFPLTHLHAFTYSKRDGTHSVMMKDNVRGDIAKGRLKELEDIIKQNNYKFREDTKIPLLVLAEEEKNGYQIGYDQFFNKMKIKSKNSYLKEWLSINDYKVKEDANYAIY